MTAPFEPVSDHHDHPDLRDRPGAPEPDDRPAGVAATVRPMRPVRPRLSGWARLFRVWLVLSVVTFAAVAVCAFIGSGQADLASLHIVIDGDDVANGVQVHGLGEASRALLAVGCGLLALLLLLMVPVLVVLVVGAVAIAVVAGVGVPLVLAALAVAVGTSPVWLVGLGLWMLVRRRETGRLAGSARMAA